MRPADATPGRYLARLEHRRGKPTELAVEIFDLDGARRMRTLDASPRRKGSDETNRGILVSELSAGWELAPLPSAGEAAA